MRKPERPERPDVGEHALAMLARTVLGLATGKAGHTMLDPKQLRRDPAQSGALDSEGNLVVHPAAYWQEFNQTEITHFCVRHGFYCIPTVELVAWLRERIAGRSAIEIGSGSGVLAAHLGIPATDNKQQEWPEMAASYRSMGQEPVRYGANVAKLDAADAVKQHQPEVVIGAWCTQKFRPHESWRGGNQYGIEEEDIIKQVKCYIHVGHTAVHPNKPALYLFHTEFAPPWLVSRAISPGQNYICWWGE